MRFRLLPSDDSFFPLFDQAAANALECAQQLRAVIAKTSDNLGLPGYDYDYGWGAVDPVALADGLAAPVGGPAQKAGGTTKGAKKAGTKASGTKAGAKAAKKSTKAAKKAKTSKAAAVAKAPPA